MNQMEDKLLKYISKDLFNTGETIFTSIQKKYYFEF
jgi:hypothetical protein